MSENDGWNEVMKLAESHGLIVQAYGGTATLFSYAVQREQGILCQTAHGNGVGGRPTIENCDCVRKREEGIAVGVVCPSAKQAPQKED